MQESLFWKGPNYQETLKETLVTPGVPTGAIEFIRVEHSYILGAAKLITGGL